LILTRDRVFSSTGKQKERVSSRRRKKAGEYECNP
jgi:hypothetical protein